MKSVYVLLLEISYIIPIRIERKVADPYISLI
jgi:hypothetical protein